MAATVIPKNSDFKIISKKHIQIPNYGVDSQLIRTMFAYPKLVLIMQHSLQLYDLNSKNNEADDILNLECDIKDAALQGSLLWLILCSNKVTVIDITENLKAEVETGLSEYCSISKLKIIDDNIILYTEGGELYYLQIIKSDLIEQMHSGRDLIKVNQLKMKPQLIFFRPERITYHGLELFVENEKLFAECPVTGITNTITTNWPLLLDQVMIWEEFLILSNNKQILIMDIDESNVILELDSKNTCYPLSTYANSFYFLSLQENQAEIKSLVKGLDVEHGEPDDSSSETQTQESIKTFLMSLLEGNLSQNSIEIAPDLLPKIISLCNQIDDVSFLIDIITKLIYNNNFVKEILYVLKKKVSLLHLDEIIKVYDLSFKFDLIEVAEFKGLKYRKIDIIQKEFDDLCAMFLANMDIDLASLCWLKYSEVSKPLTAKSVLKILNSIKPNTKIGLLIMWLKIFVPKLLDQNPFLVDVFVRWTSERVFLLENALGWPKIGCKFIEEIKGVLELFLKTVIIMPISLDDLDVLRDHIQYIIELKDKYRINMLLNELSSVSPKEVILIMLHRCYTEDLENFVNNFIPVYSTRFSLDIDEILQSFINNEASSGGGNVDALRFTILLNAFRKPYNKLDCLLSVLHVLAVPWDDKISELAIKSAALSLKDFTLNECERHLAQDIADEINYAKLKVVLKKYNFSINCTDYILLLHKIVNNPTVCRQDLQVVMGSMTTFKHYGICLFIDRCLRDCETKEALIYFNTLNKYDKKVIVKSLVTKYEYYAKTSKRNVQRCYIDFFKGSKTLTKIQEKAIERTYYSKKSQDLVISLTERYKKGETGCYFATDSIDTTNKINLFDLLSKISTCCLARNFVKNMLKTSNCDLFISKDFVTLLTSFQDENKLPLMLESHKIFTELVQETSEDNIGYISNILYIINVFVHNITTIRNLSIAWKFNYIYLPIYSLSAINDQIQFYNILITKNSSFDEFLHHVQVKNDLTFLRVISNLIQENIENHVEYQYHTDDYQYHTDEYVSKVILRMTSSQEVDELFLTSFLLVDNKPPTEKAYWLLELLKSHNEMLSPKVILYLSSKTTIMALSLGDDISRSIVPYPPQYVLKNKFNLNLGEIDLPDITEETWDAKMVLFLILNKNPNIDTIRLVEICNTLNVSINDGLSLQLIAVLAAWELCYNIFVDDFGYKHVNIESDERNITNKCLSIWESIKNKNWIKDVLNDFWENREVSLHGRLVSINPYFYEVYLCIYRVIFEKSVVPQNSKRFLLLNFLKDYKRKSTPQQYELELFSDKGVFPEIGYYRLPFRLFLLDDMWINLKSEITLETYESWLPSVSLLSLDADTQIARDMICSNALKQTMKSRSDQAEIDKHAESWQLTPKEEPLLRAAQRCVRHISNMEWAGACLFYVLQGCVRGADQVAAAHFCYQFARRWDALQPGNRAVRKMERFHSSLSTRHVLHKLEWATEELIHLAVDPAQLIKNIYLHPKLFEKTSRFDVNEAVNEIADKNGINISSIRIQLLENILEKKENENKKCIGLEKNELLVAKYILKATCPKMGAIYLSRIATDDKSDFNKCKKLRAMQCLMSIVDPETAIKVTNAEREELWNKVLEMYFIVNFEKLDLPWVIEEFTKNKTQALALICPSSISNVECLKLISEIARRHGKTDYVLKLITQLSRFSLQDEMILLLLKVQLVSSSEDINSAWRDVLIRPFECADYPISEKQKTNCLRAIDLLPLCPAISDKDLIAIWKNCFRCKCFGLACLVLPYMTEQTRNSLAELRSIDKRTLIASLKNLQTETYLVSSAMLVLDAMITKTCKRS